MKIQNIVKTVGLSALLTTACSTPPKPNHLMRFKPTRAITEVLDSMATSGKMLVDKSFIQYGKDTIRVIPEEIQNPTILANKLQNLAHNKNPKTGHKSYNSECNCFSDPKLFTQTHAIIDSKNLYRSRQTRDLFVPVAYYGKK